MVVHVGTPTAFPCGHRCTVGVLAGTHRRALDAQGGIKAKRQPFWWLLECGLVDVSCVPFQTCSTWFQLIALVSASCLTTTLESRSLECVNTYTPFRRVALFCEHFVAPTASAGCVFFSMESFVQQILINMIFTSFEISSHFSCLLPTVPLSILSTPMLICFTLKRLLCFECCLELLRCLLHLRNLPRRSLW